MTMKRWTEMLCQQCDGNGVITIPGGVSTCPHCEGDCYEPEASDQAIDVAARAFVNAHLKPVVVVDPTEVVFTQVIPYALIQTIPGDIYRAAVKAVAAIPSWEARYAALLAGIEQIVKEERDESGRCKACGYVDAEEGHAACCPSGPCCPIGKLITLLAAQKDPHP